MADDLQDKLKALIRNECEIFMAEGFEKISRMISLVGRRYPAGSETQNALIEAAQLVSNYTMVYAPGHPEHPVAGKPKAKRKPQEKPFTIADLLGEKKEPAKQELREICLPDMDLRRLRIQMLEDRESGMSVADIMEKYNCPSINATYAYLNKARKYRAGMEAAE